MNQPVPLPLRLEPVVSRTPLAGRQMPADSFFLCIDFLYELKHLLSAGIFTYDSGFVSGCAGSHPPLRLSSVLYPKPIANQS